MYVPVSPDHVDQIVYLSGVCHSESGPSRSVPIIGAHTDPDFLGGLLLETLKHSSTKIHPVIIGRDSSCFVCLSLHITAMSMTCGGGE